MNNMKILKSDNIYKYDTDFFFSKLNNFEIDINLTELIYNIFFYPFNIDKWLSKDIYDFINFDLKYKMNNNNNNLFNLNLTDNLFSLDKIRNFIFSNLDKNINIYSNNNNISYVCIYKNNRIKIFNTEHNDNKIICEKDTYILNENINKHLLLHYILNPFWIQNLNKNYFHENRTKILNNNYNKIIIYNNDNEKIIITDNNIMSCILDNHNINFENLFIKNIINLFFKIKPINFNKFDKTIMIIINHNRIDLELKKILWNNYIRVCEIINKRKNNILWKICKKEIIVKESNISIYDLNEKEIQKLRILNINGNDLFLLIPLIYKNKYLINVLPIFFSNNSELPYNLIREKIINSFFDNNYNGKKYISHYGYEYIIENIDTKINLLKYNPNFIINEKLYILSKEIEICSNNNLDLFILLSENKNNIFTNKKIYDIVNSKFCLKIKALFLIIIHKNNLSFYNNDLLHFFNNNLEILINAYQNLIQLKKNYNIKYKNFNFKIDNDYKNIQSYDIIIQYLTNNRINFNKINILKYNNLFEYQNLILFLNKNIENADFIINNKKILISNITWKKYICNIYDIIINNNKVLYFNDNFKFIINFDNKSYLYQNNKIYFKRYDSYLQNNIYIETEYNDNYLYWLLLFSI